MIRFFLKLRMLNQTLNPDTYLSFGLFCCLIVVFSGLLLIPSESYGLTCPTLSIGDEVVVQNVGARGEGPGLNVRNEHNRNEDNPPKIFDGNIGTVKDMFEGPDYTWYYVQWRTPIEIPGWSVGIVDGDKVIASTLEALQKDKLVEALFGLKDGEADLKTRHDYNDYECYPLGFDDDTQGYDGGHSGWDARTTPETDPDRNAPFYSLTTGTVIRAKDKYIDAAGNTVIRDNPPNIIAIYGDDGMTTLYLHASKVDVSVSQRVHAGTTRLGRQGDADFANGVVTGPHVHIEVRKGETIKGSYGVRASQTTDHPNVDPIPYLYRSISSATDPSVDPPSPATDTSVDPPDPLGFHGEEHTHRVNSVAFSPDGRTIASGSDDETIRLWDTATGQHKQAIEHKEDINSVAFSPDGRTIAGGSDDDHIHLWNAITGRKHQRILKGHTDKVKSVAFSPDGRTIASGSDDETIRLWDASTGQHKMTFEGHREEVKSVAFSPDGRTIASGSDDETIRLWDASTGQHKMTLEGHTDWVNSVAFSPDGRTIASGSDDETIRLWDALTGQHKMTLEGHTDWVNSVAFSPDGRTIASGGGEETIRLWDALTGQHKMPLEGHTDWVNSVAFSPDGRTLVSGSEDDTIRIWKLSLPTTSTATTVSINLSPETLVVIGEQFTISLEIAAGENVAGYQATVQFDTSTLNYVTSSNGDYLPAGAFFGQPVVDGNLVTLASASLAGVSKGNGTLATLTFEPTAVKSFTLTVSEVILVDSDQESSYPRIENAHIEIIAASRLVEDVNKDGVVNIRDLVSVAADLGKIGESAADVNNDGVVNIMDLVLVAGALGNTAAAPFAWSRDMEITPTRADVQEWLTQAQQLDITDANTLRGVHYLQQLLAVLTPKETSLLPNYPNPFNPETWIPYQLAEPADVTVSIYSVNGELIRKLTLGHQPVGVYTSRSRAAYWNGRNALGEPVASAVYFYTLTAGDFTATRKMLIAK